MTIVIGLTGNIATGKSTVTQILSRLGAHVIDADKVAHRAMAPGGPAYEPVIQAFGRGIVSPDGTIDRQRLGQIVFSDGQALRRLEAIVHPAVFELIKGELRKIESDAASGAEPVVVIEAIKLLESGLVRSLCDQIWVVTARPEQQIERLATSRGYSESEAKARMAAQSSQEEKVRQADVVIDNSGSLEDTERQVRAAWEQHIEPHRRGRGAGHEQSTTIL